MTKEVRRYTITLEKSITINLLVDKEKPEREERDRAAQINLEV